MDEPMATLPADLTDDAFLGGRLSLLQPRSGYRAGLDAVLLAAAAPICDIRPQRVLDAGAGVGTVGLCVAARCSAAQVVLLERDPLLASLATANVQRNGHSGRVRVVNTDLLAKSAALEEAGLFAETFQHVLANPPYHAQGRGTRSADPRKDASHAMDEDGLDAWGRALARLTAPGGTLTVVHKATALVPLLAAFSPRFGALKLLPIHPRVDEPASRIIVQGRKGSRAPVAILPGFVLHAAGNSFTPAAHAILRHGAALPL